MGVWIGTSLYGRYFFSSSAVARRPPSTSTASEVSSTAFMLCVPADTFLIHLFEHTRPPGPVEVPLTKIATTSTTYLAFLEMLGERKALKSYQSSFQYVSSP